MRFVKIGLGASVLAGLALGTGATARAQADRPPVEEHRMDNPVGDKAGSTDIIGQDKTKPMGTEASPDTSKGVTAATPLSQSDIDFVKKAMGISLAQIKFGELAIGRSTAPEIKELAKKMVDDQSKAKEELQAIADRRGVLLSLELMPSDQATYDRLNQLSGKRFDDAYLSATVRDHSQALPIFQHAAKDAKDDQVKSFAKRTLPTLRANHREAQRESQKM
jgi:putative membrane protein